MKTNLKTIIVITLIILSLSSCGLLSSQGSDQVQSQAVTGDNVSQSTSATSRQESNQSQKSTSTGDISKVDSILTENNDGISTWMFILGALIFGLIIPQPFFVKWMFP